MKDDYRYVYFYLEGNEDCVADFEQKIVTQFDYIQISYGSKGSNLLIETRSEKEFEKLEELVNELREEYEGELCVDMRIEL